MLSGISILMLLLGQSLIFTLAAICCRLSRLRRPRHANTTKRILLRDDLMAPHPSHFNTPALQTLIIRYSSDSSLNANNNML